MDGPMALLAPQGLREPARAGSGSLPCRPAASVVRKPEEQCHLRLAILDLDGTLKRAPDPYVYLHEKLGTLDASQLFFQQGVSGQVDYEDWLRLDAGLWKGVSRRAIEAHFRENPYLPGAREMVAELQHTGVQIAILSTGLLVHAEQAGKELGINRVVANEILFEKGLVSGEVRVHVPEGGKGEAARRLQAEFGVHRDECLAVGDGISDADVFPLVRLGVAVNPSSDRLRQVAGMVLEKPDLRSLIAQVCEVYPAWIPS